MRKLLLLLVLPLAGCAAVQEIPKMFRTDPIVEVNEIGRSTDCRTVGVNGRIQIMRGLAAVRVWETNREIHLSDSLGEAAPKTGIYALIELGQQHTGGYGIAISRQATVVEQALLLKATFITPREGQPETQTDASPCVLVALPDRVFSEVRVLDQTGKLRMTTTPQ